MIRMLRSLLDSDKKPSVAKLGKVSHEVRADLGAARRALSDLNQRRRELLVMGTEKELAAVDAERETTERRIEMLEERAKALRKAVREAELNEAEAAMPDLLAGMREALGAFEAADAARDQALEGLKQAQSDVQARWSMLRTQRPAALVDVGVDEEMRSAVHATTGRTLRVERPATQEAERPVAILGRRGWSFRGRWSREARGRFSQEQRPDKLPTVVSEP